MRKKLKRKRKKASLLPEELARLTELKEKIEIPQYSY